MRQNIIFVALSALTAAVAAQSSNSNLTVPVESVDVNTRNQWCVAQYNTCKILCNKAVKTNDCQADTLKYECTCQSGDTPDLENYTQTVPTFMCQEAYSACINAHKDDAMGQDKCKKDIFDQCGTLDPTKAEIKTTSSAAATTSAAKPTETKEAAAETSAAAPSSTSASSSFAAPTNAAAFLGNGVAAVAAGVFAAAL
ncbi:hypothetical protein QBC45DRAFT_288012, partial [Copromyces sp. CBS 386.78]